MASSCESCWMRVRSTTEGATLAWSEWQKMVTIPSFPLPTPSVTGIAIGMILLLAFLPQPVVKLVQAWPHTFFGVWPVWQKSLLYHPEGEGTQTRQFVNRCPLIHRECWDQTRVHQQLFIALCNLGTMGWQWWHPLKRAKSIRFAFDQIDSMEIPGGSVLLALLL